MSIELYDHQKLAVDRLKNGSILCGGVGTGKSRTALAYYYIKECKGSLEINHEGEFGLMKEPKDLYIITTARKRDTLEWEHECAPFLLSTEKDISTCGVKVTVDSWNNIKKYVDVKDAFFIFDEQRVVGKGAWVNAFLKITKGNRWILLSATPGDTWSDYIPVFIANGFYKNRTEFIKRHVIYNPYTKFSQIDHYINCGRLIKIRKAIIVNMRFSKPTVAHKENVIVDYDKNKLQTVSKERWDIYEEKPIKNVSALCYLMRRVVNSDHRRIDAVRKLVEENPKTIIFYNFDYELDILKKLGKELGIVTAEWNGHKHEPIPTEGNWIYLVQYTAGAEGWNCVETNVIIFYSQNYSYKSTIQAAGRIDRLNTPFSDLYYYHIRSNAPIDAAIAKALSKKQTFNEKAFIGE